MALLSARFRGNAVLESIAAGNTADYFHFGSQGEEVRAVQFALIDRGYPIADGATGFFGNQTSAAVVQFKTDHNLVPNDPVVGKGTLGALDEFFVLPFADRDEWVSWQQRPLPAWNYTRRNELVRRAVGSPFTFNPLTSFLPQVLRDGIANGLSQLLEPKGSPDGQFMPSATWGAGALDLFHVHVVVDGGGADPSWSQLKGQCEQTHVRILDMMNHADQFGREGTPTWTTAYRNLLLAPAPAGGRSFSELTGDVLNAVVANSIAVNQPLKLVWHTFEIPRWRPATMTSADPRRSWWNIVAPVPGPVTSTPFTSSGFGDNVFELIELGFLVDQLGIITVMAQTLTEAAAILGLDKTQIEAAWDAPP